MSKGVRERIKNKQAIVRRVLIPADDTDGHLLEQARQRRARDGDTPAAQAVYEKVELDVASRGILFEFRGIGRVAFEKVRREHPPTEAQKLETPTAVFNVDTFPAALCAASEVGGEMTAVEWQSEVFSSPQFGTGELGEIFNAAQAANTDSKVALLGKG